MSIFIPKIMTLARHTGRVLLVMLTIGYGFLWMPVSMFAFISTAHAAVLGWASITDSGTFAQPRGVAVDSAGDVFVVNGQAGTTNVVEELPSGKSAWIDLTDGGSFNSPAGIAVDSAGDLFVTNAGNQSTNAVEELPVGTKTWRDVTHGHSFGEPTGIAVDSSGNVFVTDVTAKNVVELKSGNNAWSTVSSSLKAPTSVAVDSVGDLFVTNAAATSSSTNVVLELQHGQSQWTDLTKGHTFDIATGIAVDSLGNVYVASQSSGSTNLVEELPSGSSSWKDVTNGGALSGVFGLAVGPSNRLVATTAHGTVLQQVPVTWDVLTQNGASFNQPNGIAVDSAGDEFIVNTGSSSASAVEELPNGSKTWIDLGAGGTFASPSAIAVDAGGDVYVVNEVATTTDVVEKWDAGSATWTDLTNGGSFLAPSGIAVDSDGNVFVVNSGSSNGSPFVEELKAGSTTWTNISSGGTFNRPMGIAVDSAGDVFVTNSQASSTNVVLERQSGSTSWKDISYGGTFENPVGIAVNSGGDVFVVNGSETSSNVVEEMRSGITVWQDVTNGGTFDAPSGTAVGSTGHLLVTNTANNTILKSVNPPHPSTAPLTPPTITADTTLNDTGHTIALTYIDSPSWDAGIAQIDVDGTALTSGDYTQLPGEIEIHPGALSAGNHTIVIQSNGYKDDTVDQSIINAPPQLSAVVSDTNSGISIGAHYQDNPLWDSAITEVSLDGNKLSSADYTESPGELSIQVDTLSPGSHVVTVKATGFSDAEATFAVTPTAPAWTAYVVNNSNDDVSTIQTATGKTGPTIGVGYNPSSIAITPDGKMAYVANEYGSNGATVIPINLITGQTSTGIPLSSIPIAIAITPNGKTAYVVSTYNSSAVTPIDLASNQAETSITVGSHPSAIAITPDGKTAYVTSLGGTVTPINLATRQIGTPISVGGQLSGIVISPDGKTAYVESANGNSVTPINLATRTVKSPISVGSKPLGIAITPDGSTLCTANANDNDITVIDLASGKTTTVPVGPGPDAIAITPDGKYAYVANGKVLYSTIGHTVSVVSLATDTVTRTISVGQQPIDVAITPDQAPHALFTTTVAGPGNATTFDASASSDATSPITRYRWDFGDGQSLTTTVPTVTHTYANIGSYTVTLTETDAIGTSLAPTFTGQTLAQNGNTTAQFSKTIAVVPVPTNLTNTNVTSKGWTEKWAPVSGVVSYNVYLNQNKVGSTVNTVYDFSSQSPGTTYNVQISSVDSSGGESALSAKDTVTTVPAAPTGLTSNGTSATDAHLTWNSATGATSYNIYENGDSTPIATHVSGTSHTVSVLTPGDTYSFAVSAVNASGESAKSNPLTITASPVGFGFTTTPSLVSVGQPLTVSGWLSQNSGAQSTPLSNASVTLSASGGSWSGSGTQSTVSTVYSVYTGSDGDFSAQWTAPSTPGVYSLSASYSGYKISKSASVVKYFTAPASPKPITSSTTTYVTSMFSNIPGPGNSSSNVTIGIPADAFSTSEDIWVTSTTNAAAITPSGTGVMAVVGVDFQGTPSKPITLTITNPNIKLGDVVYKLLNDGSYQKVDPSAVQISPEKAVITFSADPNFIIAQALSGPSHSGGGSGSTSSGGGPIPPTILTNSLTEQAEVGQGYSARVVEIAGTSPMKWSVGEGTLPPGLILNNQGIISGTPTAVGKYTFVVTVTDANNLSVSKQLTLTVKSSATTGANSGSAGGPKPQLPTPPSLSFITSAEQSSIKGYPYTLKLQTGGGVAPYTWSVMGTLPTGLSLNPNTGVISGTPKTAGLYHLTIEVKDSTGVSMKKALTMDVLQPDEREVLWNDEVKNVPAIVRRDGPTETTYMPIWYVMQLLKPMGITSTWDGKHWHMTTSKKSDLSNVHSGSGNTGIYINGTLVQLVNTVAQDDPSTNKPTTYMPIWYVMQLLKGVGLQSTWNGTTWTVTK